MVGGLSRQTARDRLAVLRSLPPPPIGNQVAVNRHRLPEPIVYPQWVPGEVRVSIQNWLEGRSGRNNLMKDLAASRARLTRIRKEIRDRGNSKELRHQQAEQEDMVASYERSIETLKSIATDERMKEVWPILQAHFRDDANLGYFVDAAWASNIDYRRFRERTKTAKKNAKKIATQAKKLMELLATSLRDYSEWPNEFTSIRALLAGTDGTDPKWPYLRSGLLGATAGPESHGTRYAWSTAPKLAECLQTLAAAANGFEPPDFDPEFGLVGAALATRQTSEKTAYIRAFAASLSSHDIEILPPVKRAMAGTAAVILNHPDLIVSTDEVSKALRQRATKKTRTKK